MSNYPTKTECSECGLTQDQPSTFCPSCGEENPWEDHALYEFDEDDFPHIFSYEVYDDGYGLWRAFTQSYFGTHVTGTNVKGFPDSFPRMKYCTTMLYYVIGKTDVSGWELQGPFPTKEKARIKREEMGD